LDSWRWLLLWAPFLQLNDIDVTSRQANIRLFMIYLDESRWTELNQVQNGHHLGKLLIRSHQ
jgi:hypothetical protein